MTRGFKNTIMLLSTVSIFGVGAVVVGGLPQPCPQDINGDGTVDSADLGILLGAYGDTGVGLSTDLDNDGVVGQPDLAIYGPYFGSVDCSNPFGSGAVSHSAFRVDNSSVQPGDDTADLAYSGGITHFAFEIEANFGGSNVWSTSSMVVTINPGASYEVYQHAFGGDDTFDSFALAFPAIVFDTAVQSPAGEDEAGIIFGGVTAASDEFSVDIWFSNYPIPTTPHGGLIARVGLVRTGAAGDPIIVLASACPGAVRIGTIDIVTTSAFTEGQLHTVSYELIENPFVSDLNGDLVVDTADLGILLGKFGTDHPYSDVNNDGVVDTADLGILLGEFGSSCP